MSSLWLNKRKKSELVVFCDQLGIESDGFLKSELETMLADYLQENESQLSSDPTFAPYYDTVSARSPPKPSTTAAPKTEEAPQKRSRRRTSRYPGSSFDHGSTDVESTPEPQTERKTRAGSRALAARTPRTLRSPHDAAAAVPLPLPPSPAAAVASEIERGTHAILASARKAVENAELPEKAAGLRRRLSRVASVNATTLALEAVLLLAAAAPATWRGRLPAVAAIGLPSLPYALPDPLVLLTAAFWAPVLTWLTTALVLPLANALLFNLVSATVAPDDGVEQPAVDPVTYAVTRALLTYVVHYKGFSFWGLLGERAVATVAGGVGRELQLVNAGIGGIAAVWEAILRAR